MKAMDERFQRVMQRIELLEQMQMRASTNASAQCRHSIVVLNADSGVWRCVECIEPFIKKEVYDRYTLEQRLEIRDLEGRIKELEWLTGKAIKDAGEKKE
jgi:hypothetical protein